MSIQAKNINLIYNEGSVYEVRAIDDMSFRIEDGEFIGIIGCTGSGKSSLVQLLNGLIPLHSGEIEIAGIRVTKEEAGKTELRKKVGLVFQYPEYQLFEPTVQEDVAFGPKNLGIEGEELALRVREAIEAVGLDFEKIRGKSPFELSGGEKRRVAIAGILAMGPEVLILDEPASGLDPSAREDMLALIKKEHQKHGRITIMISHDMNQVARLCDRIMLICSGRLVALDTPQNIFRREEELISMGLDVPDISKISALLNERGFRIDLGLLDYDEWAKCVKEQLEGLHSPQREGE